MGATLDEIAVECRDSDLAHLSPWLEILELAIGWIGMLHLVFDEELEPDSEPQIRVAWALTGFVTTQSVGIRNLCLSGLDTPAKAVLRSLIEALSVLVVCMDDPALAKRFQDAKEPKEARTLWHSELSPKRLAEKIDRAVSSLELDTEVHTEMKNWLSQESELTSQTVHVSFIAAAYTCKSLHPDKMMRNSIFGSPTLFSVRTMAQSCKTLFMLSRIAFRFMAHPASGRVAPLILDNGNETHRSALLAYETLCAITMNHWEEGEADIEVDAV